jgi:hypothetical protein
MADKVVLEAEVKSNIGEVSKDAAGLASEFKVMGVSLNSVKASFVSAGKTAKAMFGSIKAGLISTGIGGFLIIIGSLVSYFKNTKRGAEMLERALAGVGAVVSVITDLFSSVGEVIVSAFSNPKEAVIGLWEAIKTNIVNRIEGIILQFGALGKIIKSAMSFDFDGITEGAKEFGEASIQVATGMDEIQQKNFADGIKEIATEMNNESAAAMRLKGMLQKLKDEEREFSKIRAQTRQDIQKARLDALDESKTAEERLAALQTANELELKTTEDVLEMQRKKIEIQKETMALSENMAEDLDELAALEVGLIDLQTQSFQTQKRLATEMETLTNEIAANQKAIDKDEEDAIARKIKATEDLYDLQIKQALDWEKKVEKLAQDEIKTAKAVKDAKVGIAKDGLALVSAIAGEGTEIAKGAAVAQATISGIEGVQNAFTTAQKSPLTALMPAYPFIQAGLAGAFSAIQIQKILSGSPSTTTSGGGGGGGGGGTAGGGSDMPAPQMMSGAFELSGGLEPEPMKAFVVTDEMTNSQNQLANIRRRATI